MVYQDLTQAPLATLAEMALDFTRADSYRLAPLEAIKARAAELTGGGWILLSPIERDRIKCALALNLDKPECY